jgi:hypothetical protein
MPRACFSDKRLINYCIFIDFIDFQKYDLKTKDDPNLNLHFVGIIEAIPRIYNHSISDYSNKNVINNTWEEML